MTDAVNVLENKDKDGTRRKSDSWKVVPINGNGQDHEGTLGASGVNVSGSPSPGIELVDVNPMQIKKSNSKKKSNKEELDRII